MDPKSCNFTTTLVQIRGRTYRWVKLPAKQNRKYAANKHIADQTVLNNSLNGLEDGTSGALQYWSPRSLEYWIARAYEH